VRQAVRIDQVHRVSTGIGRFGEPQVIAIGRLQRQLHLTRQAIQPTLDRHGIVDDRVRALTVVLEQIQPILAHIHANDDVRGFQCHDPLRCVEQHAGDSPCATLPNIGRANG
jgi:hypothetical protein